MSQIRARAPNLTHTFFRVRNDETCSNLWWKNSPYTKNLLSDL